MGFFCHSEFNFTLTDCYKTVGSSTEADGLFLRTQHYTLSHYRISLIFILILSSHISVCLHTSRYLWNFLGKMLRNFLIYYMPKHFQLNDDSGRLRLKCDGTHTHTETRFRLSAKRTSPFKSAGSSVQSTTGSRGVRISGSNAGDTMFRGSVKSTGYPFHAQVSPSLPLPCVTVCHHISTGL